MISNKSHSLWLSSIISILDYKKNADTHTKYQIIPKKLPKKLYTKCLTLKISGNTISDKSKKRGWWNISKIKKEIALYSLAAAALTELISLLLLGANILFPYGLALGTAVAIVNTHILSVTIELAVRPSGQRHRNASSVVPRASRSAAARPRGAPPWKRVVYFSFLVRVVVYGCVLLLAARTAGICGVGCAIGFVLPKVSLYVRQLAVPAVRKAMGRESPEKYVYVPDMDSRVLEKTPRMIRYCGGRAYLTHRRFRRVKLVAAAGRQEA